MLQRVDSSSNPAVEIVGTLIRPSIYVVVSPFCLLDLAELVSLLCVRLLLHSTWFPISIFIATDEMAAISFLLSTIRFLSGGDSVKSELGRASGTIENVVWIHFVSTAISTLLQQVLDTNPHH